MICLLCREAGNHNATANRLVFLKNRPTADAEYFRARQWHIECKGETWCDCQHVVGMILNELRINVPSVS